MTRPVHTVPTVVILLAASIHIATRFIEDLLGFDRADALGVLRVYEVNYFVGLGVSIVGIVLALVMTDSPGDLAGRRMRIVLLLSSVGYIGLFFVFPVVVSFAIRIASTQGQG